MASLPAGCVWQREACVRECPNPSNSVCTRAADTHNGNDQWVVRYTLISLFTPLEAHYRRNMSRDWGVWCLLSKVMPPLVCKSYDFRQSSERVEYDPMSHTRPSPRRAPYHDVLLSSCCQSTVEFPFLGVHRATRGGETGEGRKVNRSIESYRAKISTALPTGVWFVPRVIDKQNGGDALVSNHKVSAHTAGRYDYSIKGTKQSDKDTYLPKHNSTLIPSTRC
jgi:hypothetical protein